ncbi:hypothetical protein ACU8KH_01629 [Lachancea thermotolerans]
MKGEGVEELLVRTPNVSDECLKLPRDIFLNKVQYFVTRQRTLLTALSMELAICAFVIYLADKCGNPDVLPVTTIIVVLVGFFFVLVAAISIPEAVSKQGTIPTNKLQLMKEIATVRPGIDTKEWDLIASRMNPVFYNNSSWVTPYFFYDGDSCYSYFRTYYLKPYKKSVNADNTNGDAGDEFQPFVDQAIKVYKERVNEDWQNALRGGPFAGDQTFGV